MTLYTLKFDGNYREITDQCDKSIKTGLMCYGWIIFNDGLQIARGHGGFADTKNTNSCVAEYLALIEGFEALIDMGLGKYTPTLIIGDAKSIIEQMQGTCAVSSQAVKPYYKRAKYLSRPYNAVHWMWLPRKYNKDADKLCSRAMKRIRSNPDDLQMMFTQIEKGEYRRKAATPFPLLDLRVYHVAA